MAIFYLKILYTDGLRHIWTPVGPYEALAIFIYKVSSYFSQYSCIRLSQTFLDHSIIVDTF